MAYADHRDHAIERARERYKVRLTTRDYWMLGEQIKLRDDRRARFMVKQTERVEIWLVKHLSVWMVATYDVKWQIITTFLPLDVEFDDDGRQLWHEGDVYAPGYEPKAKAG